MPNDDVASMLAAAKGTLATANSKFPSTSSGSTGGHDAGVAFAQSHNADHTGPSITGTLKQAVGDTAGLKARASAMKTLLPQ